MAPDPSFGRLALLIGPETLETLGRTHVIIVGIGGVGSWCAEALVRSGVGRITLVDSDSVCVSNINRQAEALRSTVGRLKTEALEERLKDINPLCEITCFPLVFSKENSNVFDLPGADYVIDAIDTLPNKLDLIECALAAGVRLYSSMGMAQKLDPTLIRTADIWETSSCPLARLIRQGLRKRNMSGHFTAVYSSEKLKRCAPPLKENGKIINGSAVTVTAAAGMVLASLVIRDISGAL